MDVPLLRITDLTVTFPVEEGGAGTVWTRPRTDATTDAVPPPRTRRTKGAGQSPKSGAAQRGSLLNFRGGQNGRFRAVDALSLHIDAGEALALVGESGSGKSVTALSILGLLDAPGRIEGGSIRFAGQELTALNGAGLRAIRGNRIAMIFQEPMTSLNPALTIGAQVAEPLRLHRRLSRREARGEAIRLLTKVAIPDAAARLDDYPHQFSGGMRQRVMVAMAVACNPALVIADEPTTALDVTVQAQILALLKNLTGRAGVEGWESGEAAGETALPAPWRGSPVASPRSEEPLLRQGAQRRQAGSEGADSGQEGAALLLISHDLGVVAGCADRVAVMYAGRIVETAPAATLYAAPRHPYSQGLLRSLPRQDAPSGTRLQAIAGQPPDLAALPPGCAFAPRCPQAQAICVQQRPKLLPVGDRSAVACHLYG